MGAPDCGHLDFLCSKTVNVEHLMLKLRSFDLLDETGQDVIRRQPGDVMRCQELYSRLLRFDSSRRAEIIMSLEATSNTHVTEYFIAYWNEKWKGNAGNSERSWSDHSSTVAVQRPGSSTARANFWFGVGQDVSNFIGRKNELQSLHNMHTESVGRDSVAAITLWIVGLEGVGKSSLARKYATCFGGNVIWINAETINSTKTSFMNLANLLQLPINESTSNKEIGRLIYDKFRGKKTLLIFDNVENENTWEQFMPQPEDEHPERLESLHILVTTGRTDLKPPMSPPRNQLTLGLLTKEEAVGLLRRSLKLQLQQPDAESVKVLAEKLQRFPLALHQAAACINEKYSHDREGIRKYLQEISKSEQELQNDDGGYQHWNDYSFAVLTVWIITLKAIQGVEGGGRVLELLNDLSPGSTSVAFIKGIIGSETESSLNLLERFSVLSQREGYVEIHRLVRQIVRYRLKSEYVSSGMESLAIEESRGNSKTTCACVRTYRCWCLVFLVIAVGLFIAVVVLAVALEACQREESSRFESFDPRLR